MKVQNLLLSALERRRSLRADSSTDAYRLFGGEEEGIAGLIVDRYSTVVIFLIYEGQWKGSEADLKLAAQFYGDQLSIESVYLKRYFSDRTSGTRDEALYQSEPFWGKPSRPEFPITENGVKFLIRPFDGFSTGLFLDQRNNRRYLAKRNAKGRILNCFSYTCGFSVACAAEGASTVSVDISRKALEWGKQNFQVNRIALDRHRFVATDTFDFLARAVKKSEKFDLVVLDPPSFSRSKRAGVFLIEKDATRLVQAAAAVLESGGLLFFSSNFAQWNASVFRDLVRKALLNETFAEETLPDTPADFKKNAFSLKCVAFTKK